MTRLSLSLSLSLSLALSLSLSLSLFLSLVLTCHHSKLLAEVKPCCRKMRRALFRPDVVGYNSAVAAFARQGVNVSYRLQVFVSIGT